MGDNVNHPSHYNVSGRKECIVEMEEKFGTRAVINFCELNAYKYEYRAGLKENNSREQDLKKAQRYKEYAEEYKAKLKEDNQAVMVVESLPSLYPLQPFEEEAIKELLHIYKRM